MTHTIDRKFPKLEAGNDDNGKLILDGAGKRVGVLAREIDWRDVGSVSVSYRATITGYRLEDWRDGRETVYASLGDAMDDARRTFPGLRLVD